MKPLLLLTLFCFCGFLTSCTESEANTPPETPPENGAQFKKGEGLSITDQMAQSIGLKMEEVSEEKVAANLTIFFRGEPGTKNANAWVTAKQAENIRPGTVFETTEPSQKITVQSVEKSSFSSTADWEVIATAESLLPQTGEVKAALQLPAGGTVTAVSRSTLLTTAEGHFVYAKNGEFYLRTPVKVGAMNDSHVEILEGLYAGDEVVASPVMSLWMAELQVLRGGKACTCGH